MTNTYRRSIAAIGCACALLSGCGEDDVGGGNETPRALPRVTGMTLPEAERRLEKVNVGWAFQADGGRLFRSVRESSAGTNSALASRQVTAQDPKPGKKVVSGDVVLLKLRR